MRSFQPGGKAGNGVLALLLLATLAGCGGGGGGSNGGTGGTIPTPTLSRLTLTGTVTDAPIPNAVVTATIGSQSFTATADANGNYSVEVAVEESATGGFITLTAKGAGTQAYVEFTSLVGAFSALKTQAGSDSILSSTENFSTQITNVSTALAVLLKEANGGQAVATQALIDALSSTLDSEDVLRLAAAIKLLVDEADDYPMPTGQTSLQTLLANATLREQLLIELFLQDPATFKNAQNAIVNDARLIRPITPATLPATLTVALLKYDVYSYTTTNRALSYAFNNNGTGVASAGTWNQNFTWTQSGASIDIAYAAPVSFTDWELAVCPELGFGYEPAEYAVYYSTEGAKLTWINNRLLAITETRNIVHRDCGSIAVNPEVATVARTILDDNAFQPLDIAQLRDSTRTLWIYDEQSAAFLRDVTFMPDVAELRANGTGTTRTFGKRFTWSLDASGRVIEVRFSDGLTAKFRSIRTLDPVATDMLYEFTLPTGRRVDAGASLRTDPQQQLAFTSDNVLGRHYIFGADRVPIAPGAKGSRLRFNAGGLGTRESEYLDENGNLLVRDSDPGRGFHWQIEGSELVMQYTRTSIGEEYNCDLNVEPSCRLTNESRIVPLARSGTRTYWFEFWRTGIPYVDEEFIPTTLIRYYDYEPFNAPASAAKRK